jgi:cytochrome oxidase complex assembly protein 1
MSHYPPDYQPLPAKPTNWAIVGCAGCLGLIVLLALGFGALMFFGIKAVKGSTVYTTALQAAKDSPAVREELGMPITEGAFPTGSVQIVNDQGTADFIIPISGPKGSGKIHYAAVRENGKWHATEHAVLIEHDQRKIDLTH